MNKLETFKREQLKKFEEEFLEHKVNDLGWLLPRVAYYWEESGKTDGIEWEDMEKELKVFLSHALDAQLDLIKSLRPEKRSARVRCETHDLEIIQPYGVCGDCDCVKANQLGYRQCLSDIRQAEEEAWGLEEGK